MKRDFLKNLGIEDKETIDKILDENSADIGRAKSGNDDLKSQITQLQTQLNDKTNEFNTLKESTKDYDSLKETITQLTTDKTNLQNELNTKVTQIQKTHAIEGKIRDANGKNIKAIMALLDLDKITYENNELGGIDEQLTTLASAEDSSMLFGVTQSAPPAGTRVNNPPAGAGSPPTSKTFAEAVAKALNKN